MKKTGSYLYCVIILLLN